MGESTIYGIPLDILALGLSIIAIIITAYDAILPWINRPIIKFEYEEKLPYRKDFVTITSTSVSATFLRLKVNNNGRSPAVNCRCQVQTISKGEDHLDEFQGFPLKWAGRPESEIDPIRGERLNIAPGESEFIDVVQTVATSDEIFLPKYHRIPIGIPEKLKAGDYVITLLFSGDNFKPYKINMQVKKPTNSDFNEVKMAMLEVSQ